MREKKNVFYKHSRERPYYYRYVGPGMCFSVFNKKQLINNKNKKSDEGPVGLLLLRCSFVLFVYAFESNDYSYYIAFEKWFWTKADVYIIVYYTCTPKTFFADNIAT